MAPDESLAEPKNRLVLIVEDDEPQRLPIKMLDILRLEPSVKEV